MHVQDSFYPLFSTVVVDLDDLWWSWLYLDVIAAQPFNLAQFFRSCTDPAMDSLVALDAQIISQLRDTNIQTADGTSTQPTP